MYKILFVSALQKELNVVKQEIHQLSLQNIKTSFFCSGMGNYKTILSLWEYLREKEKFDFIVNIWVCWYRDTKQSMIQVARIYNLANKKETIPPVVFEFAHLSSIACSELPIFDSDVLEWEWYVDMESYGFELVCDQMKLPRILLKVPVDRVWEETRNFDIKKAEELLKNSIDYEKLLSKISHYLSTKKTEVDYEKYFSQMEFSFAEKEIFKKLYHRFIALEAGNFDAYFSEYKGVTKKAFLSELINYLEDKKVK